MEDTTLDDLELVRSLNDIILRNPVKHKIPKYHHYVSIDDTTTLVYLFFLSLSKDYADYFEERLNNGNVYIHENIVIGQSFYNCTLGKRIIEVPLTNTLEDAYILIHEVLHDMNMDYYDPKISRELFTETISMLGELLFKDFLRKYNLAPKDCNKPVIIDFFNLDMMAYTNDFEIMLSEEFLENGYIGVKFLKEIYEQYDAETINMSLHRLKGKKSLFFDNNQTYIIGGLISSYMHDRIEKNPKNISEFFETNSIMNDVYFDDLMDYLGLDYGSRDDFVFTNETLGKLEKCYQKELKKL